MTEHFNKLILESVPDQKSANELIGKLFDITQPGVVYSQPVTVGDHTIITASEYTASMGAGYGGGGGTAPANSDDDEGTNEATGFGGGGGGGGGGMTTARPVATIIVSPSGVRVEPIVDVTKIAITMFTAFGAMAIALRRMKS